MERQPPPGAMGDRGVETTRAGLYADQSLRWPGAPPVIPVCWEAPTFDNAQLSAMRKSVEDAQARNWERFARVNLTQWDRCNTPSPAPSACTSGGEAGLHVWVNIPQAGGENCNIGNLNNAQHFGVRLPDCGFAGGPKSVVDPDDPESCVRDVSLHEFGHSVGYFHNEESAGYLSQQPPGCDQTDRGPGTTLYGAYDVNSLMSICSPLVNQTNLPATDIAAHQRFYGRRIPGSLVTMNAKCAEDNAGPKLFDCDEFGDIQEWDYDFSNRTLRNLASNQCLQQSSSCGTSSLQMAACNGGLTQQQWTLSQVFIRGWGGMCLDLASGNTNGGGIDLFDCDALGSDGTLGGDQKWVIGTDRRIRFSRDQTKCMEAPSSGSGQLFVTNCSSSNRQVFIFDQTPGGSIKSEAFPSKCLDVQGVTDADYLMGHGSPANGLTVNLFDCINAQFNQKWNFSGFLKPGNCTNNCLRRANTQNGTALTSVPCTGAENELWDYYPL